MTDDGKAFAAAMNQLREHTRPLLGDQVTKRVQAHRNGALYVASTWSGALLAWFVDSVLVNGTAIGLGVLYYNRSTDPNKSAGAVIIAILLLFVLPLLYGWFYGNGRGIGALLTGTQLVRADDGSRVGLGKAGWAMLIRTLFLPLVLLSALDGGGPVDGGTTRRVSIDVAETERLRAAGFLHLP